MSDQPHQSVSWFTTPKAFTNGLWCCSF